MTRKHRDPSDAAQESARQFNYAVARGWDALDAGDCAAARDELRTAQESLAQVYAHYADERIPTNTPVVRLWEKRYRNIYRRVNRHCKVRRVLNG